MSNGYLLEILNGGAVTPEALWLVLLGLYLSRESRRRGLRFFDWFHLPPSMNLILAVFIFDLAIVVRSQIVWYWRRFDGAGEFSPTQSMLLVASGALIVIGTLCKIRALTYPDYGNAPWLAACGLTLVSVVGLVIF